MDVKQESGNFCEYQTTNELVTFAAIKRECELPKIEGSDFLENIEHELVRDNVINVPKTIKKEFENTDEVNAADIDDIKAVISEISGYVQFTDGSEFLTSHCDLPTLKSEVELNDYTNHFAQPHSSKQTIIKSKSSKHIVRNVPKQKKRKYSWYLLQKSDNTPTKAGGSSIVAVADKGKNILEEPSCSFWKNEKPVNINDVFSDFEESGSDYQPSEVYSDSDDENIRKHSSSSNVNKNTSNNSITVFNDSHTSVNLLDDEDMFVTASETKSKKLFCMYCNKFQTKFARHLQNIHHDKEEVKKFIHLPRGCSDRKNIIDKIKKKSQFYYNTSSMVNDGELIVSRRPPKSLKRQAKDYKACQKCKGFFTKNNIRHHAAMCFSFDGKKNRTLLVMGRKIEGRIHPEASDLLRKVVFPVLREDSVVRSIRYDRLLILYANKMCCKYRLQHQHDRIRSNLRLLGRFLIVLKERNKNINEFSNLYDTDYFDDVIYAINQVAGFDEINQTYKTPATAYNLGSLIKKIANICITDCIKRKDKEKKINTEEFLNILNEDLATIVNKTVSETQQEQCRRKKVELPSKEDIKIFHNYLTKKRRLAFENLNKEFSILAWNSLIETTLTSIQLFNRRRAGELERIFIDDYNTYERIKDDSFAYLSTEAKHIAKNYVRFYIRGKLGRSGPVLLSQEMISAIELILKYRKKVGVPDDNKYLFGIPSNNSRMKYLRACALMRNFSNECSAKFPATLRGTSLRKHVATNCINLNLSENELTDVADFMGHSKEIHKQHYRQPIISREILRMSHILEKAQGIEETNDCNSSQSSESDREEQTESEEILGSNNTSMKHKSPKKRSTSPFGPVKHKKRWTSEESQTAWRLFNDYIEAGTYPSLKKIQAIILENPVLKTRVPCVIKTWISNQIKKKHSSNN